jgi:hypothetical protein
VPFGIIEEFGGVKIFTITALAKIILSLFLLSNDAAASPGLCYDVIRIEWNLKVLICSNVLI